MDNRAYENWDMSREGPIDLPWDLLDKQAVCRLLGGSKPINVATLYRHIRQGRLPKPVKIGGSRLGHWGSDEE